MRCLFFRNNHRLKGNHKNNENGDEENRYRVPILVDE